MSAIGKRCASAIFGLLVVLPLARPASADNRTVIDLTYDSMMDMARPEVHPGIKLHHVLQVTLSGANNVEETRSRSAGSQSDKSEMQQALGGSGDAGSYAVWHVVAKNQLVRTQNDPQSTRTMTVTLTSPTTCQLEVRDQLKAGFNEYAFMRISQRTLAYFSSYRVTDTTCAIH